MPSPLGTQLLTGDTLMTMNGCTMSFMRLPSGGNPAAEEWSVDLPFDDWSAALHPPTNVVVVSEHTGSTSNVQVHILRMDTGEPHPFANKSVLKLDLHDKFTKIRRPDISISQTTMAILFHESDENRVTNADGLFVWNWRTGSMIYSQMNTSYDTVTLVRDTWLVAGYSCREAGYPRRNRSTTDYALFLMDTSAKSIRSTLFQIRPAPHYVENDGYFSGLHSGESALYNRDLLESGPHPLSSPDPPEDIITAVIQHTDTRKGESSAYCITMRISKLLELGNQGKTWITRGEWEHHTFTSQKVFTEHDSRSFSVSGWRLVWRLQRTGQGACKVEVQEFDPQRVEKGKEVTTGVLSSIQANTREFNGAEDSTEVALVGDTLVFFKLIVQRENQPKVKAMSYFE